MTTRELINSFTREEGIALFNTKKTDKEIYDLLVSKGLTDSYETYISEAQKVFTERFSQMSKEEILAQIEGAELTDEQLAQIAGGKLSQTGEDVMFYGGIGVGAACAIGTVGAVAYVMGATGAAAAAGL